MIALAPVHHAKLQMETLKNHVRQCILLVVVLPPYQALVINIITTITTTATGFGHDDIPLNHYHDCCRG
jgi:hypothetical protein